MISRKAPLREVYVWQLPVRIFHWVNAFVITVLCITGYIIGDPPAIMHGTAPEANYWFGWVRLAHFIAAFIFVVNFAVRIYWFFAGNSFAKWYNYIPLKKKQWRGILRQSKLMFFYYLQNPYMILDIIVWPLLLTLGFSLLWQYRHLQDLPCFVFLLIIFLNHFSHGYFLKWEVFSQSEIFIIY